jgi:nucleoside-diphosphate-sugar epimerase
MIRLASLDRKHPMHIFVTGGSGITGPAVVSELLSAGHAVTGLARSDAAAARLRALGATPHRGSLDDLDRLAAGARAADGALHMAFGGSFGDPHALVRRDCDAIDALGRALVGTGKPLVSTSGTLVMATGRVATEEDQPDPASIAPFRIPGEQTCLSFADQGVRASVVRLAPTVHGPGDYGFVPVLVAAAARNGVSAYVGDGANRWPAIHRLDAARLFRLALERAPAGSTLHGVGETGVTIRSVAELIGRALDVPAVSLTVEDAAEHLGNPFLAGVMAADAPVSSALTQALLGWTPDHPTLLEDMVASDYFAPEAIARTERAWAR